MITRIKGTHDLLDMSLYNHILTHAHQFLARYHFTQITTPILESTDLFKRSLGLETDVVSKEMFIVSGSHESEESICLRPEATASTMRTFLEHGQQTTPWQVYTVGPMFRYERPQKGRFRQFNQISIEVIGSSAVMRDVQFITMLDRFFQRTLKLDCYALLLNFLGCAADRAQYKKVLYDYLQPRTEQLCSTCLVRKEKNILRIFDCKNPQCQSLYKTAPALADYYCADCAAEWKTLQETLELLSVSFSINPHLVRGLDYYDKVVFEFVSANLGAQSAFCSGGRYNGLAEQLGSSSAVPSIGAAVGIERLMMLLEHYKDQLMLAQQEALYVVAPYSVDQQPLALLIADTLRAHNFTVDILCEQDSFKSMMRKANKMAARACLIIGPDEQAQRQVTVKDMVNGTEQRVNQVDLVTYLKK